MPGDTRGRSRARRETGVEVAAAIPGRATRRRALQAGFRSQRRELPPWTGRSRPPYSSRVPSRSEGRGVVCSPGDLLRLIVGVVAKTRAELALITGRARSTVSQRVDALVQQGWLVEAGEAPSTGGRRPTVLEFNRGAGIVLLADVGATYSRVAVADLAGTPLAETRRRRGRRRRSPRGPRVGERPVPLDARRDRPGRGRRSGVRRRPTGASAPRTDGTWSGW